jgi:hypothetical protein
MKNKVIKTALLATLFAAAGTGFQSCDLEEYNPSGSTADVVFQTPKGLNALANSIYYTYRWKYFGREDPVLYMEGGTDLWYNYNLVGWGNQFTQYLNLDWAQAQTKTLWERQYDVINLCNTGIDRIGAVEYADPEEKKYREGEFRFMRAFSYWWLVEFFGDIPMKIHETTDVEMTAVRTPAATIYDEVIIPDLQAACELLALEPVDGMVGRVTRKSAYGALARIALTRAAYGDAPKYYQMARDAADHVINNRAAWGVSLYADYADVFASENNKTNKEALYFTTFSTNPTYNPDGNPNRLERYYTPVYKELCGMTEAVEYGYSQNKSGGNNMGMMPTRRLLTLFDEGDLRYDASFREVWYENKEGGWEWTMGDAKIFQKDTLSVPGNVRIEKGDTALFFTRRVIPEAVKKAARYAIVDLDMVYDPTTGGIRAKADNTPTTEAFSRFFPRLTKFDDPSRTATNVVSKNDVILIRLAEMYLVAAEAATMLGQTGDAAGYINDLRKRAIRPGYEAEMRVEAADMNLEFILDERARELCGEHIRWFDLKRTGKLVEYVKKYNPNITAIKDFHVLRPIPQQFLQSIENAKEFGQNPGYTQP